MMQQKVRRSHGTFVAVFLTFSSVSLYSGYGQVSKRFDFCTASAFGDARLTLVHEDAAEFVKREVSYGEREKSRPAALR